MLALTLVLGIMVGAVTIGIVSVRDGYFTEGILERQFGYVVGVSSRVEPNKYNTLAQQLEERSNDLDAREFELDQREEAIKEERQVKMDNAFFIITIGLLLLILILINFFLDWRRGLNR